MEGALDIKSGRKTVFPVSKVFYMMAKRGTYSTCFKISLLGNLNLIWIRIATTDNYEPFEGFVKVTCHAE